MTGRIKLLKNGVPTQPDANLPEIPYSYDHPTEYDESCGSYGITDFQLPNPQCPERFVCDAGGGSIGKFADCIESQNCFMFMGMTTGVSARSEIALFLHMMIPHHENAINMAKTLLQHGKLDCDEFDDEIPGCVMFAMGLSIVDSQNFQVQQMTTLLKNYDYPESDDCIVPVSGQSDGSDKRRREMPEVKRLVDDKRQPGQKGFSASDILRIDNGKGNLNTDTRNLRGRRDGDICISSTGRYTIIVDLYAGELGTLQSTLVQWCLRPINFPGPRLTSFTILRIFYLRRMR
jgi:Domain of unknown function (DUF305)